MTTATLAPASFGELSRAEWTKIRSVRSTLWSLGIMAAVSVAFTVVATAIYTGRWHSLSASDRAQMTADPIGLILQPGSTYGQIAICVLGVMVIAAEYSTGMIRSSVLAVPRRNRMLGAKAAVFAVLTFVVAELIAFPSFLIGSAIMHEHVQVSLGDPGVLRAVVGFGLYLATMGLLALAIGAIVRHVAGAITVSIGIVLVLSTLASLLPGSLGDHVSGYLPATAGQQIMSSGHGADAVLSPWQGYGVMCMWTVALLALAAYLLNRRDA